MASKGEGVAKTVTPKEKSRALVAVQEAFESLTGRLDFARKAGLMYRGRRDVYETAGYLKQGEETFAHYWGLYERDPIAGRIIDMPAQTTWKTPPEILDDSVEEQTRSKFVSDFTALSKRLRLWHYLERADRLSRIGRYSILLLGTNTEDRELKEPLETLSGPDDLLYLGVYSEKDATINTWETKTSNPRFGFPLLYQIDVSSGISGFPKGKLLVHHSRVIHIAEDLLTDEVFGRPVLKRILNRLFDLEKISAATGEAYWQLASRVLSGKIDPEAEMEPAALAAMGEALEEMVHDLRRHFVGQGVDLSWLESTPPDPTGAADFFMTVIASAAGIPKRILFGTERGELASSQDERNYMGSINERQESHAEPNVLRAFINKLIDLRAIARPGGDGEYSVTWPQLFEETAKELAETNRIRAATAKELTPIGGDPLELVTIDADGDVYLREWEGLPLDPKARKEELASVPQVEGGDEGGEGGDTQEPPAKPKETPPAGEEEEEDA